MPSPGAPLIRKWRRGENHCIIAEMNTNRERIERFERGFAQGVPHNRALNMRIVDVGESSIENPIALC